LALAAEGAIIVLTGRRREALEGVAGRIAAAGGTARVEPGDLTRGATAGEIVARIAAEFGRLDILVNNAGANIVERSWAQLTPERIDTVITSNLSAAFYCASAVLPIMRRQKDGVLIHTGSWAGKFVATVSGSAYTAAKHGVVAMSHTINMEECANGIRSTTINPAEVATPILDKRPVPIPAEERAVMLQPADLASIILYVATLPPHVVLNEVVMSPTQNRSYLKP
jgi:NADP-dependent 3-hydroxy acid dehydrogenase YdfG